MILEIAGMPRSGKSTICDRLATTLNNVVIHPERFDAVPEQYTDGRGYDFNRWYLDDCIERIQQIPCDGSIHLFQRAINDRVSVARAMHSLGWWKDSEYEAFTKAASDAPQLDHTILFHLIPSRTLNNTRSNKKSFTRDITYLIELWRSYQQLVNEADVTVLGTTYTLEEAEQHVRDYISNAKKNGSLPTYHKQTT